jgi:hypothetical protein
MKAQFGTVDHDDQAQTITVRVDDDVAVYSHETRKIESANIALKARLSSILTNLHGSLVPFANKKPQFQ